MECVQLFFTNLDHWNGAKVLISELWGLLGKGERGGEARLS